MRTDLSSRQVRDIIVVIFEDIIGAAPPRGLDTTPDDLDDWSSLAQIRLLHAIEEHLGCLLDERFLTAGPALAELADAACAAVGARNDS
jgi:acyl carrier protein